MAMARKKIICAIDVLNINDKMPKLLLKEKMFIAGLVSGCENDCLSLDQDDKVSSINWRKGHQLCITHDS